MVGDFNDYVSDPSPSLDPRYEWIEITTFGGPEEYIRGHCKHLTPIPVYTSAPLIERHLVAWLCPDCDLQMPGDMYEDPQ